MKLLTKHNEYVAPECNLLRVGMLPVLAGSFIKSPLEVEPVEEDDWGDL